MIMKKNNWKIIGLFTLLLSAMASIPAFAVTLAPYCGDGLVSPEYSEECDDANYDNRDGCSAYCKLEDLNGPHVSYTDIPNGQVDVSTLTKKMRVTFSEPVDPKTINTVTVIFKKFNQQMPVTLELLEGNTELIVHFDEELEGNQDYALIIQFIKDALGNLNTELFVNSFKTGKYIDVKPPNIVARPPAGHYNVAQAVSLTPYIDKKTFNDIYIDTGAKVYYTLDGTKPTTASTQYKNTLSLKFDSTLKFFGVDATGNASEVQTVNYTFGCAERAQAKTVTDYPECKITECNIGYQLQNDICLMIFGEQDDFKALAATAPLFGSDTPVTISTKPAVYITPEHNGIVPRPIHFVDLVSGSIIDFKRDTIITREDGTPFTGYILPPSNLYNKSFPLNFGYSFKSIFDFQPADGGQLTFDPMIEITIPFTDRYNEGDPVTVFTYDENTQEYFMHDPNLVGLNETKDAVHIYADSTDTFFVAQPGQGYNQIAFKDTISHWAKNYIEQLYRWEMVKGKAPGIFAPDDNLTRAEFTKIVLGAIGEEVDPYVEVEASPFYDINPYAWYLPYIDRAKEMGLVSGYPDGSFKPEDPINKVEAIKMLMNAFKFDVLSVGQRSDNFQDILTWEWYFPTLNFALQNHMIDGIRLPNGKIEYDAFGPGRAIKRSEMAKLAVKAIELNNALSSKK